MKVANPHKIKDGQFKGEWGVSTRAPVKAGDLVTVETKSGKTWEARIHGIISETCGVCICTTASTGGEGGARKSPPRPSSSGRLVGYHTDNHCSCGNWAGAGSPCLYSYSEAKDEDEARFIRWERQA